MTIIGSGRFEPSALICVNQWLDTSGSESSCLAVLVVKQVLAWPSWRFEFPALRGLVAVFRLRSAALRLLCYHSCPFRFTASCFGILVVTRDGCFCPKWNSGSSNSRYSGPIRREPAFESVRVRAVDTSHLLPTPHLVQYIRRRCWFKGARVSRGILDYGLIEEGV